MQRNLTVIVYAGIVSLLIDISQVIYTGFLFDYSLRVFFMQCLSSVIIWLPIILFARYQQTVSLIIFFVVVSFFNWHDSFIPFYKLPCYAFKQIVFPQDIVGFFGGVSILLYFVVLFFVVINVTIFLKNNPRR
jgi:hypothetical protein